MKYIVKNCPAYSRDYCNIYAEGDVCQDIYNCPIRQIVNECKSIIEDNACTNCKDRDIECWQCENEYRYRSGLPELDLPKQILQILQVEEAEE